MQLRAQALTPGVCRAAFLAGSVAVMAAAARPAGAESGEISVLSTDVFAGVLDPLFAEFARRSGTKVTCVYATAGAARSRLGSRSAADVAILPGPMLAELEHRRRILPGSIVALGHTLVGIAVRPDAPIPVFVTLDDFKQTLLGAKAISYPNPAGGNETGVWFAAVLERLGIAGPMRAKTIFAPPGRRPADLVGDGEVALAIDQPLSIFRTDGASLVAFVPQELHGRGGFTFAMAVVDGAANARGAQALIAYLHRPESAKALGERGMDPG